MVNNILIKLFSTILIALFCNISLGDPISPDDPNKGFYDYTSENQCPGGSCNMQCSDPNHPFLVLERNGCTSCSRDLIACQMHFDSKGVECVTNGGNNGLCCDAAVEELTSLNTNYDLQIYHEHNSLCTQDQEYFVSTNKPPLLTPSHYKYVAMDKDQGEGHNGCNQNLFACADCISRSMKTKDGSPMCVVRGDRICCQGNYFSFRGYSYFKHSSCF